MIPTFDPNQFLDAEKNSLGATARRHFRAEAAQQPDLSLNKDLWGASTRVYHLPEPPSPRSKKGQR